MADIDRAKVKRFYAELRGYLDTIPEPSGFNAPTHIAERLDKICDELSTVARNDYSHFKVERSEYTFNEYGFDGSLVKMKLSGIVNQLNAEFEFDPNQQQSQAAIIVNNQNTSNIDIKINFSIDNLIESAQTKEEKEKLKEIKTEIEKPHADWSKISKSLAWILSYSRELSLKLLPIILNHYLKQS
ncbi:MAG TPA: hypothetical protein VK674_01145 [Candidatus Limnocylindria bacterium]|nr:hypothetical protein [Candidatus Limnocylindria bacterium]